MQGIGFGGAFLIYRTLLLVIDVSRQLDLTRGSVSAALASLEEKEYITTDQNKFLQLTDQGALEDVVYIWGLLLGRRFYARLTVNLE
mgnify:CR=1 FL=1